MCKRPPSHYMSKCPPLVDCPMRVSPVPSPLRPFLSLVESVNRGGLSLVLTLPGKLCSPSPCSASPPPPSPGSLGWCDQCPGCPGYSIRRLEAGDRAGCIWSPRYPRYSGPPPAPIYVILTDSES